MLYSLQSKVISEFIKRKLNNRDNRINNIIKDVNIHNIL